MLLCTDVGNTNIKFALYDGDKPGIKLRFATNQNKTADDYAVELYTIFKINSIDASQITGSIISSVVPKVTRPLCKAINKVCNTDTVVVGPGVKTGLDLRIDNPISLGSDIVSMCVAVKENYSCPAVVIGMGTATTIVYLNDKQCYCGGAIIPGVSISLDALTNSGALLPDVDIEATDKAICTNTEECIQSGVVHGTACMIDGMIEKFKEETNSDPLIIATGGLAENIVNNCKNDIIINDDLIMDGLKIIFAKNKK